jgi:hypothetical protein
VTCRDSVAGPVTGSGLRARLPTRSAVSLPGPDDAAGLRFARNPLARATRNASDAYWLGIDQSAGTMWIQV